MYAHQWLSLFRPPISRNCPEPLSCHSKATLEYWHLLCCLLLKLIAALTHRDNSCNITLSYTTLLAPARICTQPSITTRFISHCPFALLNIHRAMDSGGAHEDEPYSYGFPIRDNADEPREDSSGHSFGTCQKHSVNTQRPFWPSGLRRELSRRLPFLWEDSAV